MNSLDIAHMHFTRKSPEAPLKMQLLHYGEVAFDGDLKLSANREHPSSKLTNRTLDRGMRIIKHNKASPEEIVIVNTQVRLAGQDGEKSRG